jgi:hypothetical protein
MEERSEDRVQEPTEDFLSDSVFDHGDAQGSELSVVSILRNIDPAQRRGLVRALFELPHQSVEVVHLVSPGFQPGFNPGNPQNERFALKQKG